MRAHGSGLPATVAGLLLLAAVAGATTAGTELPSWAFRMHLWPFDILYPDTGYSEIRQRLDRCVSAGADSTIVYLEEEHMYGTFVLDEGFTRMLVLLRVLVTEAHDRDLRVIVYLNGLEVMTHDAVDPETCSPLPGETMARRFPAWLQHDLGGEPIVYTCLDLGWVTPDMEDAWISPFSPYRDLFKRRLAALGEIGVDGAYIDATFMPGLQPDEESLRWGTTDAAAAANFSAQTGFPVPTRADWSDPDWRAWLLWRHEVIRDYLGELAAAAMTAGMVPFWESSSNDTPEGTVLGNETAITAELGIGFSPEIEPEDDWLAAFRMTQAARDLAPHSPLIFLGWPVRRDQAELELAIALAFSDTLYPTADAPYPDDVFAFANAIEEPVLDHRRPYWGNVALIYSVRNKDWSYQQGTHFDAYDDAFRELTRAHIPFRVLVLEQLDDDTLAPFSTVVLPAVASISDTEHALLRRHQVIVLGDTGSRDELWQERRQPLAWPSTLSIDPGDLTPDLPMALTAPATTYIAFYTDGAGGLFLFAVHEVPGGELILSHARPLQVTVYRQRSPAEHVTGNEVVVLVRGSLTVLHVAPFPRRPGGRPGPGPGPG
jgi:hypothetical protein